MKEYKISVVIPVYNGEGFVKRAIESVLAQTYPAFEIIVINDGSTDGTEHVLKQFGNKITVKTIPNGGVSNARNVGIHLAQGEFIAFLDADDIWSSDKLMRQVEVMVKYPTVGFCCSNYYIGSDPNSNRREHFSVLTTLPQSELNTVIKNRVLAYLLKENFVGTCSNVLVRKTVLEQTGVFDVSYRQAEDYDLWLRCALVTDFFILAEPLLFKVVHETNLTNNYLETCLCHQRVLREFLRKKSPLLREQKLMSLLRMALADKYYEIGNLFFENHQYRMAFVAFFSGLSRSWTLGNVLKFLKFFIRKLIRFLSFGWVSRKNLTNLTTVSSNQV